jgi:hypothetical protein
MLSDDLLRESSLLVFANKQDLPNAMNCAEITDKLSLASLSQRSNYHIQSTCATTGDGLYDGLDWLAQRVAAQRAAPSVSCGAFQDNGLGDCEACTFPKDAHSLLSKTPPSKDSTAAGSAEEWVQSSFGPPPGFNWPQEKRAALSAALLEEEFYQATSIAAGMDEDTVAAVIKAAGLKAGTSKDFRNALAVLRGPGGSSDDTADGPALQSLKVRVRP